MSAWLNTAIIVYSDECFSSSSSSSFLCPRALRVRKKTGGENMPVQLIGDLLASELAHMQPYIRFCSCQLNAAALLQSKTNNLPDFKDFLKVWSRG